MIKWLVILMVGLWMVRRNYNKRQCRKHGHVWKERRNRLRCTRCKAKSHRLTVIKPESRRL